jgi:hypothetical protein
VQECVPENISNKIEVFTQLDQLLTEEEAKTGKPHDIILASSTR